MKNKKIVSLLAARAMAVSSSSAVYADQTAVEVPFSSIPGILVGNVSDTENGTGCTVIVVEDPNGATASVDVRGGSPGTRETDLLDPTKTAQTINAVCLAGGSAFGLEAADGVMQYLEEKGMGVNVGPTVVPIVPSAILFDLTFGNHKIRPDKEMGYQAADNAFKKVPWSDGNTGAGTGATVGKSASNSDILPMKGGLGSFAYKYGDLYMGAIVAVNAAGNIVNPENGDIIAGAHTKDGTFIDLEAYTMTDMYKAPSSVENTTIGCIVTNAKLTKAEAKKLAEMAHDGFARAIHPVHTASDGDTIFTIALGDVVTSDTTWDMESVNMNLLGVMAVNAMENAIVNAGESAETLLGVEGRASMENIQLKQP